jgi:hypothetical protein
MVIKFHCLIYFSGWTHGNGTRLPAKDRQERGGNSIATPVPVTKRLVILKISYLLEQAGLVGRIQVCYNEPQSFCFTTGKNVL